ncbi:MAG TPA: hypothetical protein VN962_13695 [Polyangia bacterium]|nr:hypothetical protein [Polyangia bacterium]
MSLLVALSGCFSGGYREAHLSQPAEVLTRGFAIEVSRVYLNEETVTDGVGDGTALVVQLNITNRSATPYQLSPGQIWCLLEIDARHPDQTRMFPPSVSGPGEFTGYLPEARELPSIDVPPGQTRTAWVLFQGYRFKDSDIPRKVTLTLPDPNGKTVELVLADPGTGYLRWIVPPTRSTFAFGVQDRALYGGYAQINMVSTRLSRMARAGRFLWDIGLVSTTVVQVKGALRSSSSSFGATGFDFHLSLPLLKYGEDAYPIRFGPYVGGELQLLIATEPTQTEKPAMAPPVYGEVSPEIGLEMDVGALRLARLPFPVWSETRNPVPRWLFRIGYTHTWIGHGTADGYLSSFRIAW